MSKNLSMTLKLGITLILAIAGILYILDTPPVSGIRHYEKTSMPRPAYYQSDSGASQDARKDGDEVSLLGKSGRYDEVRIGK